MFARFLVVGAIAFVMDTGLTSILIAIGFHAALARIPAIAVAMTFAWLANRSFTYDVAHAGSVNEVGKYGLVAGTMAMLNYLVYATLIAFGLWHVAAIAIATAIQSLVSFHAYRKFVFDRKDKG